MPASRQAVSNSCMNSDLADRPAHALLVDQGLNLARNVVLRQPLRNQDREKSIQPLPCPDIPINGNESRRKTGG